MMVRAVVGWCWGLVLCVLAAGCASGREVEVALLYTPGGIKSEVGGEPFANYFGSTRRPVVWPIHAPSGVAVTRAHPFADVVGEPKDHVHHESLWFAHGDLNGVDFWAGAGRVESEQMSIEIPSATVRGVSRWLDAEGGEVCRDVHALQFLAGERDGVAWRAIDVDYTWLASNGPLRIGDTKEGTFGVRLRPELCLRGQGAAGSIVTSEGHRDAKAWGKRARWVAYSAVVEGAPVTVALFDHPDNHGHPTYWHARDYGLVAANPFGLHDFTGAPKGAGEVVVPPGGTMQLRYRVWISACDKPAEAVEQAYRRWRDSL